jgi:hypothetical protein
MGIVSRELEIYSLDRVLVRTVLVLILWISTFFIKKDKKTRLLWLAIKNYSKLQSKIACGVIDTGITVHAVSLTLDARCMRCH